MAQTARAINGASKSAQTPSEYTSRTPRTTGGTTPGNSGSTPCATCAMAGRAGSAGLSPVRAWLSLKRRRETTKCTPGAASRRA
eukprot:9416622-Lingulodinium_polyedra.AAC.1